MYGRNHRLVAGGRIRSNDRHEGNDSVDQIPYDEAPYICKIRRFLKAFIELNRKVKQDPETAAALLVGYIVLRSQERDGNR